MEMEMPEGERVVVAKPVASRPSCSTFKSFSELLAGAINASSPPTSENAVAAIRPKTVRFKPPPNPSSSKEQKVINSGTHNEPTPTHSVVYKPLAKLVSKTTVSLLANMGNCDSYKGQQQQQQQQQQQVLRVMQANKESSNPSIETAKEDRNTNTNGVSLPPTAAGVDRPSYDGYNWRKYGQKQVKGSEYPRSYYKCTHPNCPVKKKVERSFDGQIAEIVYKGEHSHSKPHPPKRNNNATTTTTTTPTPTTTPHDQASWNINENNNNQLVSGASHDQLAYQGNALVAYDPIVNGVTINAADDSCGISGECQADNDQHRTKRRKTTESEGGVSGEEARVVVQSSNDTEMIGDGFRWRKYGQKVVKGNPYPRSYYRCTSVKCNVRKHVERASEDPKAFITTYEGKHNHDMPLRTTTAAETKRNL